MKKSHGIPIFFDGFKDSYDVEQGVDGDSWFVASLVSLASSPYKDLLARNVPTTQNFGKDYFGGFFFKFWNGLYWEHVLIDDKLPTVGGRLFYSYDRTSPNEFWIPLLEKAYAKFKGGYRLLKGVVSSNLSALTGGVGKMYRIGVHSDVQHLKSTLSLCQRTNTIVQCGVVNNRPGPEGRKMQQYSGLYCGHAYNIVSIDEERKAYSKGPLMRIRSPWANSSDDIKLYKKTLLDTTKSLTELLTTDNEFFVSLFKFMGCFDVLEICCLSPDRLTNELSNRLERKKWRYYEYLGTWRHHINAGGPPPDHEGGNALFWKNPQIRVTLDDTRQSSNVLVYLTKPDTSTEDFSIGFVVFTYNELYGLRSFEVSPKHRHFHTREQSRGTITGTNHREQSQGTIREQSAKFTMPPVEHIIIPFTEELGQECDFSIRIFSEREFTARM